MRRALAVSWLAVVALVAGFVLALRTGPMPLGVAGQWEWLRLPPWVATSPDDWMIAVGGIALYGLFAALGGRSLARKGRGPAHEGAWVAGLVVAAVAVQVAVQSGAPAGFGLAKWSTLGLRGSSGYYSIAKEQVGDLPRFLAEYPEWVRHQDALHIGTHPPGLIVLSHLALRTMERHPALARGVLAVVPGPVDGALRATLGPLPTADRAALAMLGALTLLLCCATVAPLYLLARTSLSPPHAWATAVLWPLVPAAVMFQPTADTAFPFLSTAALALVTRGRPAAAVLSGGILAVGMALTLAFLPVGLVVAMVVATASGTSGRRRLAMFGAVGAGFLLPTLAAWIVTRADPFAIWWWNQRNHARFYAEYRRDFAAWVVANPIELAVAIGLPAAAWMLVGLASRRAPRASWATLLVLALLTLSGRNLSEVARLWLPLMPPLLPAAAAGLARLDAGRGSLALAIGSTGLQLLALQATIQVVYAF